MTVLFILINQLTDIPRIPELLSKKRSLKFMSVYSLNGLGEGEMLRYFRLGKFAKTIKY